MANQTTSRSLMRIPVMWPMMEPTPKP
jgi:hypothetical protein